MVTKVEDNLKGEDIKGTLISDPNADTLTDVLGPDKFICGQGIDIVRILTPLTRVIVISNTIEEYISL